MSYQGVFRSDKKTLMPDNCKLIQGVFMIKLNLIYFLL
jgi:hypothetical protein